jgi:hypothetical protein
MLPLFSRSAARTYGTPRRRSRPRRAIAARPTGAAHLAVEQDLAGGRLDDARHALDQRRLAGAVGTEQAVDLARLHVEVDALERAHAGELLDEPADLEDRAHPTTSGRRFE